MLYAIGEIIAFLFAVALLAFILGWLLRGPALRKQFEAKWKTAYETERERADRLQRELETCTGRRKALENAQAQSSSASVERSASSTAASAPPLADKDAARQKIADIARRTAGDEEAVDDDLKKIRGIGPKLEGLLKEMGITSYRQIARFELEDIGHVAAALGAFPGRIERDNWMEGARNEHFKKYGEEP